MNMNKIKFSHEYTKMPVSYNPAFLMEVLSTTTEDLSKEFVSYDTTYMDFDGLIPEIKNYPLPKGKILVLLLLSDATKRLWTTIRRWTPEKEAYYRRMRGEQVEIVIEPKANI